MIEQRKNQRFALRLPFHIVGFGPAARPAGETRNVSSSGVLFTFAAPVPVGEPIEYVISFPRSHGTRGRVRLHCLGIVLRQDQESAFAATLERYEFVRYAI
ncbi:MAG TPA: PilZ domain-containing protein [Bryobacteraceae bacterium]|nr:PilZ domain-containing protein [Bryobacteraceae bacterium]